MNCKIGYNKQTLLSWEMKFDPFLLVDGHVGNAAPDDLICTLDLIVCGRELNIVLRAVTVAHRYD